MRVLVTGASGYLGRSLVARLRRRPDWEVVGFGHKPRGAPAALEGITYKEGDVTDATALRRLGAFDAVIHLAGGGGPAKCEQDPTAAVRANVLGTANVAAAARTPRMFFASTIAVYGTARAAGGPFTEAHGSGADDLYGAVKEAAERAWPGTSLRLANVYGAGAGGDLGLQGAVERFARAAASGGELTVYGTGAQRIDYVHIDDVGDAFERALDAPPRSISPVLNIGGGAPVSIRELAELAVAAGERLGAKPRIVLQEAPRGKIWPDRSLSIKLAEEVLGWTPRVPLATGMNDLVAMMHKQSGSHA